MDNTMERNLTEENVKVKKIRIHSHPWMERQLDVPKGHVIIDDNLYCEIKNKYEGYFISTLNKEEWNDG